MKNKDCYDQDINELTVKEQQTLQSGTTVRELEDKLKKTICNEDKIINSINTKLEALEERVKKQKICSDISNEEFRKQTKAVENSLKLQIGGTLQSFEERERDEIINFDKNAAKLNNDINYEACGRSTRTKELLGQLSDLVSFVQGELHSERKSREEIYDTLISRIGNEMLRVDKQLQLEKKEREESHLELTKMLNDCYSSFTSELDVILLD